MKNDDDKKREIALAGLQYVRAVARVLEEAIENGLELSDKSSEVIELFHYHASLVAERDAFKTTIQFNNKEDWF